MNFIDSDAVRDLALVLLLCGGLLLALMRPRSTRRRIAHRARIAAMRADSHPPLRAEEHVADLWQRLLKRFASLGERVPVGGAAQRNQLGEQLVRAGFRERRAVSMMIGFKLLVGALFALVAIVLGPYVPRIGEYFVFRALMMGGVFIVGMMLPELALNTLISRRQKAIASCLPDALDLLVICTNAGNSLVVGVKRVARELKTICPPLADEFAVTGDELQVSGDSAGALRHLAARIGLPSVRALVTTLIQSQQYGTPITHSLRMLSRAERTAQMMTLEEKAAKLATKMTLPMMFFILPTVGLIAAGPAVIRLIAVFK
ncbi:type II secretion system F family protein [Paraburkholderia madseniana]|jgi:tight adherence protein C|uniref:Type II secretion system F family protein n=1 Tax=Paraburkholderia madseniana TaxID=2599607 RepID=A0A6N6WEA9_9BURK|nr:type II secretion system F family protein [Paraburkholderia madseniana]NPT70386.1 type II secretion system F family protein [Paraburkholderia madseniana]